MKKTKKLRWRRLRGNETLHENDEGTARSNRDRLQEVARGGGYFTAQQLGCIGCRADYCEHIHWRRLVKGRK